MERPRAGIGDKYVTQSTVYEPGEKTHRDENFPVASYILRKQHRAPVLAFYRFARAADDIADHPHLIEQEKIARLDAFEATLLGASDAVPEALPLREALASYKLTSRHALDLLIAFRQDARKARYRNWNELMQYCRYSAAPVGRFVLDVHGESKTTWPASDALCSALQIINHLQDCRADYQRLDRVYIPQDALTRHGTDETALSAPQATPALRACITELAAQTGLLFGSKLAPHVKDTRLRIEVLTIDMLAHRLIRLLLAHDPLSERVHLGQLQVISIVLRAILSGLIAKRGT